MMAGRCSPLTAVIELVAAQQGTEVGSEAMSLLTLRLQGPLKGHLLSRKGSEVCLG